MINLNIMGESAKNASRKLAGVETNIKNSTLVNLGNLLVENKSLIIEENLKDIENAKKNGLEDSLIDRLTLTEDRIVSMSKGVMEIADANDPIGEGNKIFKRPNGLEIRQVKVPIGVIGMIYESRPNVTIDAAALALKSGNAIILRGGKEALNTNICLANIISIALKSNGLPESSVQIIDDPDRKYFNELITLNNFVDVIIPRGGKGLKKAIIENATIPVIETGAGVCHVFVDEYANFKMAEDIAINAKVQRPGVCNSIETLLIHKNIANYFLPIIYASFKENNVEMYLCEKCHEIIGNGLPATEEDWKTEYLRLAISIKIVSDIDEAIDHIYKYGTKHSEAIVTNDYNNARKFQNEVDASSVYVNASTRFTDGSEFGFGAEIGISTQKLHARGPMGLNELTTTKYLINGNGQIR
jgi:glutamate-5-semialdehyde dehydrogenase